MKDWSWVKVYSSLKKSSLDIVALVTQSRLRRGLRLYKSDCRHWGLVPVTWSSQLRLRSLRHRTLFCMLEHDQSSRTLTPSQKQRSLFGIVDALRSIPCPGSATRPG